MPLLLKALPRRPTMTDPLTLEQAAAQLGMSPASLRVQVHRGVLKARRLGPINVVDQTEVDRYRAEHRRVKT